MKYGITSGLILGLASFVLGWVLHFVIWRIKRPGAYPIWLPVIFFLGFLVAAAFFATRFSGDVVAENVVVLASAFLLHGALTVGYLMGYAGIIEYSPSAEVLYAVGAHMPDGVMENALRVESLTDEFLVGKRLNHLVAAGLVRQANGTFAINPLGRFVVYCTIVYRRMLFEPPFGKG